MRRKRPDDLIRAMASPVQGPVAILFVVAVIRRVLSFEECDFFICGHNNLLPIAWINSAWTRLPLLLGIHGIETWTPHIKKLVTLLARRIDACICVSEVSQSRFISWSGSAIEKCYILSNCIDIDQFRPSSRNKQILSCHNLKNKTVLMTLRRLVSAERCKGR